MMDMKKIYYFMIIVMMLVPITTGAIAVAKESSASNRGIKLMDVNDGKYKLYDVSNMHRYEHCSSHLLDASPLNNECQYAQTFTIGNVGINEDFVLSGIRVKLWREGNPTGNIFLGITSIDNENTPSPNFLSIGCIDSDSLMKEKYDYRCSNGGHWRYAHMTPVFLHHDTQYALVVFWDNMDDGNNVYWMHTTCNRYDGGNLLFCNNGVWSNFINLDYSFMIYGNNFY